MSSRHPQIERHQEERHHGNTGRAGSWTQLKHMTVISRKQEMTNRSEHWRNSDHSLERIDIERDLSMSTVVIL